MSTQLLHIDSSILGANSVSRTLSASVVVKLRKTHSDLQLTYRDLAAAPLSPAVGMSVATIERQAKGAFFVVQINRRDGDVFTAPPQATTVGEGDGVVLIGRPNRSAIITALIEPRIRTGARG